MLKGTSCARHGPPSLPSHYEIEVHLGDGSFGCVHLAIERRPDGDARQVAVKTAGDRSDETAARLIKEGNAWRRIAGRASGTPLREFMSCVVPIHHEYGDAEPFVAMEFMGGGSLRSYSDTFIGDARPTESQIRHIGAQIAGALALAHYAGVIHRDVRPDNIYLHAHPRAGTLPMVALGDWGMSWLGSTVGSVQGDMYAPRHQHEQPREIDRGWDVHALAKVLVELASGDPRTRLDRTGLTSQTRAVLEPCLSETPGRWPQAADLATALRKQVVEGVGTRRPRPILASSVVAAAIFGMFLLIPGVGSALVAEMDKTRTSAVELAQRVLAGSRPASPSEEGAITTPTPAASERIVLATPLPSSSQTVPTPAPPSPTPSPTPRLSSTPAVTPRATATIGAGPTLDPRITLGRVTGIALDQFGSAVSVATAKLFDVAGREVSQRLLSSSGRFELADASNKGLGAGTYKLRIEAPDHDSFERVIQLPSTGLWVDDVTVRRWGQVTAVLVSSSGQPLQPLPNGPISRVYFSDAQGRISADGRILSSGRVEMPRMPDGDYTLHVRTYTVLSATEAERSSVAVRITGGRDSFVGNIVVYFDEPPVIDSLGCTGTFQVGTLVTCVPSISGTTASTRYEWSVADSFVPVGSPSSGTGPTFSTTFDRPGTLMTLRLRACNGKACDELAIGVSVTSQPTPAPPPAPTPAPAGTTLAFAVPALGGADAPTTLAQGDRVTLTATGIAYYNGGAPPVSPDGDPSCPIQGSRQNFTLPTAPCWALIGRVGSGTYELMGSNRQFIVSTAGTLHLGMNDDFSPDNNGSWQVSIVVERAGTW